MIRLTTLWLFQSQTFIIRHPFCFVISFQPVQFALSPSDFSSTEVPENELEEKTSRGVKILYKFPWGLESLETLWCRGDAELLQTYKGIRTKLHVSLNLLVPLSPHVLSAMLFHS